MSKRQAHNRRKLAYRIQARAILRASEILEDIPEARGANQNIEGGASPKVLTRTGAARDAGFSERQRKTGSFGPLGVGKGRMAEFRDEPAWLRSRIERLRSVRSLVNDRQAVAAISDLIAEVKARLSELTKRRRHRAAAGAPRSARPRASARSG